MLDRPNPSDFDQSLAEKGDGEEALIRDKDETDVKVCWCPHSL